MPGRIARRKLAAYFVDELDKGVKPATVIASLAAYLCDSGRTREYELIVRDIEDELASRGTVIADVTSAHPLSAALRKEVIRSVGAKNVQLREQVDASVLGGVRIDTPGQRYDGTIRKKLNALKAKQV